MLAHPLETLRPELRLLLACARVGGPAEPVDGLLAQPLDWEWLLRAAQAHRVLPLLFASLQAHPGAVPAEVLARLRASAMANLGHNRFRTGELLRLLGKLADAGIAALPLKGAALAERVYGSLALRYFGDLDILVREADAPRARALLLAEGYAPTFEPTPGQLPAYLRYQHHFVFVGRASGIVVELHYRVREGYFSVAFDCERLLARAQPAQLGGRPVALLAPEDTLLTLCVHGASHCWERLIWVCDIAEFLRAHPQIDWAALCDEARRLGALRMLALGLRLAELLLGAQLPAELPAALREDRRAQALAGQVLGQVVVARARTFAERVRFHLAARERVRDRASYCARLALTPTEGDWSLLALPARLTFLYYGLRPLRLTKLAGVAAFRRLKVKLYSSVRQAPVIHIR